MLITESVLNALKRAVEKAGNPSKFAAKLPGIKQTTVRNWLLGITRTISAENWEKVSPLIQDELSDMEDMHCLIEDIGPDKDLWTLLVEWQDMRDDIKQKIIALTTEAMYWNADMSKLSEAGFDVLRPEIKKELLNKYGGLTGLVDRWNASNDDGEAIRQEITKLALQSSEGVQWFLKKNKALIARAEQNGILESDPALNESVQRIKEFLHQLDILSDSKKSDN